MSILIKGMEMPKSCSVCRLFGEYGCPFIGAVGYALTRGERNEDCHLVTVPEHGRLVDADKLEEEIDFSLQQVNAYLDNIDADYYSAEYREMEARAECYRDALEYIRAAPTVIPEEDEA